MANNQKTATEWILSHCSVEIGVDDTNVDGQTALSKAAWCDLPEVAEVLLKGRADPSIVDKHCRNALHKAAWGPDGGRNGVKVVGGREAGGSPRCVQLFLQEGWLSCIHVQDSYGATPVQVASSSGAADSLEVLLACEEGRREATGALASTAFRGQCTCLRQLLSALADPYACESSGYSALDHAVAGEREGAVEELLLGLQRDDPLDDLPNIMLSAVSCACRMRSSRLLGKLMTSSFHLSTDTDLLGLCVATAFEDLEPLKSWPPFQVPLPSPTSWDSRRAALEARSLRLEEGELAEMQDCCEILLSRGAKVLEQTLTVMLRNRLVPDRLLQVLISSCPGQLSWPLVAAVEVQNESAVKLLLDKKANPSLKGGFALASAAACGRVQLLQVLTSELPSTDLRCSAGFLSTRPWPLDSEAGREVPLVLVAAHFGQAESISLLLERQPFRDAGNGWVQAAADQASVAGHADIAHWLLEKTPGSMVNRQPAKVLSFEVQRPQANLHLADCTLGIEAFQAIATALRRQDFFSGPSHGSVVDLSSISFVSDIKEALAAIEKLRSDLRSEVAVIGIDLECYHEVVCTVQISWQRRGVACHCIFDALLLHQAMKDILAQLLTDPNVVKVFHSPHNDLRWLRSNFGLCVCNIFDTATAYQVHTEHPNSVGLKDVCKNILHCSLDKQHQTSDWRLRPLPADMLLYASTDAWVLVPLFKHFCKVMSAKELTACWTSCRDMLQSIEQKDLPQVRILLAETTQGKKHPA